MRFIGITGAIGAGKTEIINYKTKESVQLSEQNKFNSKANDTKKLPEIINKEHKLLIHNETQFNQEENKNDKIGDTSSLIFFKSSIKYIPLPPTFRFQ